MNKILKKMSRALPIDLEKAQQLVNWMYEYEEMKVPNIHIVSSPKKARELEKTIQEKEDNYNLFLGIRNVNLYNYFEEFGTDIEEYQMLKLNIESNIFLGITLEKDCILISNPKTEMNDVNQYHCISGPALDFGDYKEYYINGIEMEEKTFYSILNKKYTLSEFLKEKNEEIKSICIQCMELMHGLNFVNTFFTDILKEIDIYVDKKPEELMKGTTGGMNIGVYRLLKGKIDDIEIAYVQCYCPSTDRMFILGVDPIHTFAKDAIASLYRIPKCLKPHIVSISRQGERFYTILSKEGLKTAESLKNPEYTFLQGDEYFNLMKYEF